MRSWIQIGPLSSRHGIQKTNVIGEDARKNLKNRKMRRKMHSQVLKTNPLESSVIFYKPKHLPMLLGLLILCMTPSPLLKCLLAWMGHLTLHINTSPLILSSSTRRLP
jgi:hypothetical protein